MKTVAMNRQNPRLSTPWLTLLAAMLLFFCVLSVHGADTPTAPTETPEPLSSARALISAKNWAGAIEELRRVNLPKNADWNNLMGYSHRKAGKPDFAAAERYYNAALAIEPRHRGALEYSGELFLMMGDLARAQQRLAALDKACLFPCEEYTDLKKAVASFKSNGNRYVAKPN